MKAKFVSAKRKRVDLLHPKKPNQNCELCNLSKNGISTCVGVSGPPKSKILLVGEALGEREDLIATPFAGDYSQKLNFCLEKANLDLRTLQLTNIVKCKPIGKSPSKKSIDACYPYLLHEILSNKPKVIVALGAAARKVLFATPEELRLKVDKRKLDNYRGFPEKRTFRYKHYKHQCWVIPTYHPSLCLRDWTRDRILTRDLETARNLAHRNLGLKEPGTKIKVVKNYNEAMELIDQLDIRRKFVTDLETTGLSPHSAEIMCAGFCFKKGEAHILPFLLKGKKRKWTRVQEQSICQRLAEVLAHSEIDGQNIKFDIKHYRKKLGVVNYKIGIDTMLAHHCVDENMPHNLTFLCQWYLGWTKYDEAMEPFKIAGKRPIFKTWEVPDQLLHRYCGYDVDGTWQLGSILMAKVAQEGVVRAYNNERDLITPLADVEYRGIQADTELLKSLSFEHKQKAAKLRKKITTVANRYVKPVLDKKGEVVPFNPRSPQQLTGLFQAVGAKLPKRTHAGNISVDKNVIAQLAMHPKTKGGRIAKAISDLRFIDHRVSHFLDGESGDEGFARYLSQYDRWHPNYNIGKPRTARLSADDPAIQTLPKIGGMRKMIIPDQIGIMSAKGFFEEHAKLFECDYSKLELCVLAWAANDAVMAKELINGVDLHTRMAVTKRLMRDPNDEEFARIAKEISEAERALAKGVNFGVVYGQTAPAIVDQNPDKFPLNMPRPERIRTVQKILDAYFRKYVGVAQYQKNQIRLLHKRGYSRSAIFNRKRRLNNAWLNSQYAALCNQHKLRMEQIHLENEALNFNIQAIASDILSMTTKKVYEGIRTANIPTLRIILSLHDALIFSCHAAYIEEAQSRIKDWMEVTLPKNKYHKFAMPLKIDTVVMENWGEHYE